jgi:hypothetical protein
MGRSVREDVAVEEVVTKNEKNLVPPSSVGGRGGVEEDGDQVLDVRDLGGLKVEVGDHRVIRATRGSSTELERSRRRMLLRRGNALPRRGVEEALCLGDLASKRVNGGTLMLLGEGGQTHALIGGCSRGLGILQGNDRDGGGTRRQPAEEGGGGQGSGRRRHSVEGTVEGAEQQVVRRNDSTNTSVGRSTIGRNSSGGGGDGGVGAAHRG